MKKLNINDRKVKFWFKFGPFFKMNMRLLSTDLDIYSLVYKIPSSKEVEIFIEHTNEDQWSYDVVDFEGEPILHSEEGLVDVDVVEKDDESGATSEECESFS